MKVADAGDRLWYFAYGSNLDAGTFLGRRRMQPLDWRRARLDRYRLVFDLPVGRGERAVANVRPDVEAHVHGVAWLLSMREVWHLDRSEGVHRGYYRRLPVQLALEDGSALRAFTYASSRGREGRKPSARYRGLLLAGARQHGLPETWIEHLLALPLAHDERESRQRTLPFALAPRRRTGGERKA